MYGPTWGKSSRDSRSSGTLPSYFVIRTLAIFDSPRALTDSSPRDLISYLISLTLARLKEHGSGNRLRNFTNTFSTCLRVVFLNISSAIKMAYGSEVFRQG